MENINLLRTTVRQDGENIVITHKSSGMQVKITTKRLDAWAVKILRESLNERK